MARIDELKSWLAASGPPENWVLALGGECRFCECSVAVWDTGATLEGQFQIVGAFPRNFVFFVCEEHWSKALDGVVNPAHVRIKDGVATIIA